MLAPRTNKSPPAEVMRTAGGLPFANPMRVAQVRKVRFLRVKMERPLSVPVVQNGDGRVGPTLTGQGLLGPLGLPPAVIGITKSRFGGLRCLPRAIQRKSPGRGNRGSRCWDRP